MHTIALHVRRFQDFLQVGYFLVQDHPSLVDDPVALYPVHLLSWVPMSWNKVSDSIRILGVCPVV